MDENSHKKTFAYVLAVVLARPQDELHPVANVNVSVDGF